MESQFLENTEKKIQGLAGKIHHVVSTKMVEGVCKHPNMELARMYFEKEYENELKRVGVLPENTTIKPVHNKKILSRMMAPLPLSNPPSNYHRHCLSVASKIPIRSDHKNSHRSTKILAHRDSWSASNVTSTSSPRHSSKGTSMEDPPTTHYKTGLTESNHDSYDSLNEKDMYTLNEERMAQLNITDKEYTGYESEGITDNLLKKEKLLPPISSIPESVIQNSEALKEYKKKNINRPRSMIPLRKEIVFKEDIPPEYLQKKAEGPFLPTYMLNRTLNKPEKLDSSLRNQTDIYETPNKFKEDKEEQDKKILHGSFKLSKHPPPYSYTNTLQHNEPWVQPKDPNTIISETVKFTGKHDFRTRLTSLCYDAYKDDFK